MSNDFQDMNLLKSSSSRNCGFNFTIGDINRAIIKLFGEPKLDIYEDEYQLKFIKSLQSGHTMSLKALFNLVKMYNGKITLYFDLSNKNSLVVNNVDDFISLAEKICYNKRIEEDKNLSNKDYKESMEKRFLNDESKKPFVRLSEFLAYKFYSSNFKISFGNKGSIEWFTKNKGCTAFVENNNIIISYDIKENKGEDSHNEPTLITKISETPLKESDKKFIKDIDDDIFNIGDESFDLSKKSEIPKKNNDLCNNFDKKINEPIVKNGGIFIETNKKGKNTVKNYNKNIQKLIKLGFIDESLKLTEDAIEAIENDEYQINRIII